jgi:undecaprenyl-diphosphatase
MAVILVFAWLTEEVFEGDAQVFDEGVRSFVNGHSSPALTAAMRVATYFGSTVLILSLTVCSALIFYLIKRRRAALLMLVMMTGALVLNTALKLSFHRTRPAAFFGVVAPHSYSFPSGHALHSLCLFGTLAALLQPRLRGATARLFVWVATAAVVALVGFSRIYLGVHYPTDVLAGYAAGAVWVLSVTLVDRLLKRREGAPQSRAQQL